MTERKYDAGTQRLLDDLEAKPQSFDRDEILRRAKKLRYHDYISDDAMCTTTLIKHLAAAGFDDLARNAMADKYSQGPEESAKWAQTAEGRRLMAEVEAHPELKEKMTAVLEKMGEAAKGFNFDKALEDLRAAGQAARARQDTHDTSTADAIKARVALEARCREIGRELAAKLPPEVGMTLFLYDYGQGGALAFISTGQREDVRRMLAEFLESTGGAS